jgi:hypothetical protein
MIKFLSFYLLFFLFCGVFCLVAQDKKDTLVTNSLDTGQATSIDPGTTAESMNKSRYRPVADSLFSPSGLVREVPAKEVNSLKKNPDYAYANDPAFWRTAAPPEPGMLFRILFSRTLGWILLTLTAGLVLYGIYQLAIENHFGLLIRKGKRDPADTDQGIPAEKMNFDEAIQRSQEQGDYRMAVRFLYLRLIHILREKSGIPFNDSSTNADITGAMGNHPQAAKFRWLATAYEYIFYGGFLPNREMYDKLKDNFEALQKIFSD